MPLPLDERPLIVALCGPNGAGKSTFHAAHLAPAGLPFLNADTLGRELGLDAYKARYLVAIYRDRLVQERASFVFETVLSDPAGEKVEWLHRAAAQGYHVVLLFIRIATPAQSDERVALRVHQGGHDVPPEKVRERFPRTLRNLARAIRRLPYVRIYDNSDLRQPFREIATFDHGVADRTQLPAWLTKLLAAPPD